MFAKAVAETFRFWSVHRNWTVIAAPISAVTLRVMRDGYVSALKDLKGTLLAAALGYVVAWLGTLLINVLRSPWILDRDRQTALDAASIEVGNLKAALEQEQYNLSDSPQLILGFNEEFFIRNIGNWAAQNARIHSMRVNNVLIYSDRVNYVGAGDTVFNLRCRREEEGGSPVFNLLQNGVQAFRMFIEEIIRSEPLPEAITSEEDPAKRATREYQFLMTNDHMLTLDLMYTDFSGHDYLSPAIVAWTLRDGGRIVVVRPQTIKKLNAAEAAALNKGEYGRRVAGVDVPLPGIVDENQVPHLQSSEHQRPS